MSVSLIDFERDLAESLGFLILPEGFQPKTEGRTHYVDRASRVLTSWRANCFQPQSRRHRLPWQDCPYRRA